MKLGAVRWLIVCHGVTRPGQGNNDVATLHFEVKLVRGLTLPLSR